MSVDETCHVGRDDGVTLLVTNLGRGPSRRMCQVSSPGIWLGIFSAKLYRSVLRLHLLSRS